MTNGDAVQRSGANPAFPAKHLATFTIRASSDVDGNFLIHAKAAHTYFRGGNNQTINWNAGSGITVTVR